jgi:hypothetical protein
MRADFDAVVSKLEMLRAGNLGIVALQDDSFNSPLALDAARHRHCRN